GLSYVRAKDQLICYGENMPVDVLLVRDDDIPMLVQENVCDLGIAGRNVIEERRYELAERTEGPLFKEISLLDFGRCRLSFGVPEVFSFDRVLSLACKRIATRYPRTVRPYLVRMAIVAQLIKFSSAVKITPRIGKAYVTCEP